MPDKEPAQEPEQSPGAEEDPQIPRVGSGGDDMSAGITVSGLGGEELTTERPEKDLRRPDEQGARLGWGQHPAADDALEQAASNEGTGQTEKPPAG